MEKTSFKKLFMETLSKQACVTEAKNYESVVEQLKKLNAEDLIALHNQATFDEEPIGLNENEFFQEHYGNNFIGALKASAFGNYNANDAYVYLDEMGNLHSAMEIDEWVDYETIAEYLEEYEHFAKKYGIAL